MTIINIEGVKAQGTASQGGNNGQDQVITIVDTPPANSTSTIDYTWFIDKGSFIDRFGPAWLGVLSNPDATLHALLRNMMVRNWIDLSSPETIAALSYINGAATPGLGTISVPVTAVTTELITTILSTPPTVLEQYCTVKLFFS